jgi:hypothetical protein
MYNEKKYMSAYLRVITIQPSDRETLPHPDLQEVRAISKVGVRTTPRDPIAQRTVQPSQCSGPQLYVAMVSHSK